MKYLSITETAKRLGVTRQSVWSRINSGIIHADRVGNVWVVPESEAERIAGGTYVASPATPAK